MTFELVVIGGGNMGAALLGGLLDSGAVARSDVAVVEPYLTRRGELEALFEGVTVTDEVPACSSAVLAVKPPDIPAVARAAAAAGAKRVLSVAAGVTKVTGTGLPFDDSRVRSGGLAITGSSASTTVTVKVPEVVASTNRTC